MGSTGSVETLQFQIVKDPLVLEPVLAERLPLATNVYNVMKLQDAWKEDQNWRTLQDPGVNELWIVVTFFRKLQYNNDWSPSCNTTIINISNILHFHSIIYKKSKALAPRRKSPRWTYLAVVYNELQDYGQIICVSRPPSATTTPEVQAAFSNCDFIDWKESFMASSVDVIVSSMLTEISAREKGNWTQIHPCYLYAMDIKEALKLSVSCAAETKIQPLNTKSGKEFVLKTWKYTCAGTESHFDNLVSRNPSAGVCVNGEPVAGVVFDGHGLIGMLYTLEEHRSKGYGRQVMHQLMKSCAENKLIPSCTVEIRNDVSMAFQEKIGFTNVATVDFVVHQKSLF